MFWSRQKKLAIAMTCLDRCLHWRVVGFNGRIGKAARTGQVDLVALPGPDGLLEPERAGE
jgi:hypothetical protein